MIDIYLKLFYNFKFYHNVLTQEERQYILLKSKPLLQQFNNFPGLQTYNNLHEEIDLHKLFKVLKCNTDSIQRSWINYTSKEFPGHICYHTHPHNFTCVYYFDDGYGTMFMGKFRQFQINARKNTLIVFPASIPHSAPINFSDKDRFTLAFDFD